MEVKPRMSLNRMVSSVSWPPFPSSSAPRAPCATKAGERNRARCPLPRVEEHDPLHLVAGHERYRHRAAHAQRDDRLAGGEPLVADRVAGEDALVGGLDLLEQRVGDQHLALARLALPHRLDDQL